MGWREVNKPVDLSKVLGGKIKNRINMVGIELEGGWTHLPKGTRPIRDGSVNIRRGLGEAPLVLGEIPSAPLTIAEWPKWVETFHPHVVNETCGLHVHLSFFTAFVYQRLMCPEYPATIVKYVEEWARKEGLNKNHQVFARCRGGSEYCQLLFDAESQIMNRNKDYDRGREGHRYTVVNYSYGFHSTIECRLLPMMENSKLSISAVQNIIDITNAFLVATATKEESVASSISIPDTEVMEEHVIRI